MKRKMNGNELYEQFKQGYRPVVRFASDVENYENFDPDMKARLVSMYKDEECYCCVFDFTDFEEYNKSIEQPVWNGKHGEMLKWSESAYYPKDKRTKVYVDFDFDPCFVIEQESQAFKDYRESGSELSYINWLEDQYLRGK
jgi:hypothetical protein